MKLKKIMIKEIHYITVDEDVTEDEVSEMISSCDILLDENTFSEWIVEPVEDEQK